MQVQHFDLDEAEQKMRAASAEIVARLLESEQSARGRAFVQAQAALIDARVAITRVYLNLKGSGHDDDFVAGILGVFVGGIMVTMIDNSDNADRMIKQFKRRVQLALSDPAGEVNTTVRIAGAKGGRA